MAIKSFFTLVIKLRLGLLSATWPIKATKFFFSET